MTPPAAPVTAPVIIPLNPKAPQPANPPAAVPGPGPPNIEPSTEPGNAPTTQPATPPTKAPITTPSKTSSLRLGGWGCCVVGDCGNSLRPTRSHKAARSPSGSRTQSAPQAKQKDQNQKIKVVGCECDEVRSHLDRITIGELRRGR